MVEETFRRADDSLVSLISQRPNLKQDIDLLLSCLNKGRSIFAGHAGFSEADEGKTVAGQRLFCQSSGSSDQAKTIRRTAASWNSSFSETAKLFSLTEQDGYAVLGALSHSLTLYGILEGLYIGAHVQVLTGLSPRGQLAGLRDTESAVLYATPSQLRLLLEGAKGSEAELPHLKLIFSGGGKLDPTCRGGLASLCPNAQILEFYGASETSLITLSDSDTPEGSVGRAYPGVEVRICGSDGSELTEPGSIGEIWIKSPYLFEGYEVGSSSDTIWRDGFLTVGEMGVLDADGFLYLKGRKSRMITVADQNVFLEDVEAVLQSHDAVRLCAALARPDAQRGHIVEAVVEAEEAPELISDLQSRCRHSLGALATPKVIHLVDAMPLLPAGKPDLRALVQMFSISKVRNGSQ